MARSNDVAAEALQEFADLVAISGVEAVGERVDLHGRARAGGVFAIDTDFHSVLHFDNIRFGVATAQRGWVAPGEVINTWPLRRLRSFLAKGRRPGRARTPVTPARAG